MKKEERITLELYLSNKMKVSLSPYVDFISKRVGANKLYFSDDKNIKWTFLKVKDEEIGFKFLRVNF